MATYIGTVSFARISARPHVVYRVSERHQDAHDTYVGLVTKIPGARCVTWRATGNGQSQEGYASRNAAARQLLVWERRTAAMPSDTATAPQPSVYR